MLDLEMARERQRRLLGVIFERNLEGAVICWPGQVQYFTAHRAFWQHESALWLKADGEATLIAAKGTVANAAVDRVVTYDSTWNGTQREDQARLVAEMLRDSVGAATTPIGVDIGAAVAHFAAGRAGVVSLQPELHQLRRRKDADELAVIRRAIECGRAMYRRAREIIGVGLPELRMYGELHAAAVETAGEPLSAYLGNDYACGEMGGPPRAGRVARDGELYILDLGPAVGGYFSDASRALAVNRRPTDLQFKAWNALMGVFPVVEKLARPGARCRELYAAADAHLREKWGTGMVHHLGHGVGLQPHEFPHLNPAWDDVLAVGDVFTLEPGIYTPELRAGLRLENQYLVTETAVENLTNVLMDMA